MVLTVWWYPMRMVAAGQLALKSPRYILTTIPWWPDEFQAALAVAAAACWETAHGA